MELIEIKDKDIKKAFGIIASISGTIIFTKRSNEFIVGIRAIEALKKLNIPYKLLT